MTRQPDLTAELVALCHRPVADPGPKPGWAYLDDAAHEALATRFLAEAGPGPIWIFAYGSLIWNPGFQPVGQVRARARGWHRSFCMHMPIWRGTEDCPGLMMALERGGSCTGFALALDPEAQGAAFRTLLRREVLTEDNIRPQRWIRLETEKGPLRALGFWVGPTGPGIRSRLPLAEVAPLVATACGPAGSNAEYLYNTVRHLREAGLRDSRLEALQGLVAAEILARHRGAAISAAASVLPSGRRSRGGGGRSR